MAKKVVITKETAELTKEEAKQYILEQVFKPKEISFRVDEFSRKAAEKGLETDHYGELEKLVNELIEEGKLRVMYSFCGVSGMGGFFLIIKRVDKLATVKEGLDETRNR